MSADLVADLKAKGGASGLRANPAPAQGGATGLIKARRGAGGTSGTGGDEGDRSAAGGGSSWFSITDKLIFEFAPRNDTTVDPCTLGTLASTVTGIRKPTRGPKASARLAIGLNHLYNGLSMFRFAQRAIEQYNSTLGANVKLSMRSPQTFQKGI